MQEAVGLFAPSARRSDLQQERKACAYNNVEEVHPLREESSTEYALWRQRSSKVQNIVRSVRAHQVVEAKHVLDPPQSGLNKLLLIQNKRIVCVAHQVIQS